MSDTKMLGREKVLAVLARVPVRVPIAVGTQLATEVEGLTEAIKENAPVGTDLEKQPGQLRDSVHFYPNRDRPLSYSVIADAKDDKGEFIGLHVEHGHKARDGSHVPRVPFFFPTYRARKKGIKRRLNAAARKSATETFEGP